MTKKIWKIIEFGSKSEKIALTRSKEDYKGTCKIEN